MEWFGIRRSSQFIKVTAQTDIKGQGIIGYPIVQAAGDFLHFVVHLFCLGILLVGQVFAKVKITDSGVKVILPKQTQADSQSFPINELRVEVLTLLVQVRSQTVDGDEAIQVLIAQQSAVN